MLGDAMAALAIPLLVLDLTRNPLVSALSAASVTAGYLLAGLPAGVLVDRLDPWRVLIAMDAARMVLFAGLYALWRADVLGIWLTLTLAMSAGACSVFSQSAMTVVVKDLFAVAGLMAANSTIELANQVSVIIGPAVVGLLAATGEIGLALLADALTFAVCLACLATVMRCSPVAGGPGALGPRSRAGRSSPPASGRACATCSRSGPCFSSPRSRWW